MSMSAFAIQENFNTKNAMASSTVADLLKVRKQTIRECLTVGDTDEHRMETVLSINGVTYVNDAKANNVNATFFALEDTEAPIVWIAGGVDHGNDYDSLLPLVREKVKAIICLGKDNGRLFDTFSNVVDVIVETEFMNEAVKIAYKISNKSDVVLLSPACASYDLFENYSDKGEQFRENVRNL